MHIPYIIEATVIKSKTEKHYKLLNTNWNDSKFFDWQKKELENYIISHIATNLSLLIEPTKKATHFIQLSIQRVKRIKDWLLNHITRPLQYIIYILNKLVFYPTSSLSQKFTSSLPEGNSKVNFHSCFEFEENLSFCNGLITSTKMVLLSIIKNGLEVKATCPLIQQIRTITIAY